jgi:hypothetical protein
MRTDRATVCCRTSGLVLLAWWVLGSPNPPPPQPASAARASQIGTTQPAVVYPHWSADGCRHCHPMEANTVKPVSPVAVDGVCLACHDGKKAEAESHPIGRPLAGPQLVQPAGWPTDAGRIGCATCHDILSQGCRTGHTRSENNPAFLRDYQPGKPLAFCAHCHSDSAAHHRHNPHVMLKEDNSILPGSCRFCHTADLDEQNRTVRTGNPALRMDPIQLCIACHTNHVEFFSPGHIGAEISADLKAHIVAFERRRFGAIVQSASSQQAGPGAAEAVVLPLADGKRAVCSTCHNPHQRGLFPPENVLSFGAIAVPRNEASPGLPLRGLGKELCVACHN